MKYGERKPISKAMRQQVYDKYHGHCAYCGRKIEMKEMEDEHGRINRVEIGHDKELQITDGGAVFSSWTCTIEF